VDGGIYTGIMKERCMKPQLNTSKAKRRAHPMGEENFSDFAFETYCGKVVVEATDEAMTPFGGLVPWAAFQKKSKIIDQLAKTAPVM
jgi:hypothetical protein